MSTAKPTCVGTPDATIVLTGDQARAAQYPLLVDLQRLLEAAAEQVHRLHESPDLLEMHPVSYDTRRMFEWIAETVGALDALGWKAFCDKVKAESEDR